MSCLSTQLKQGHFVFGVVQNISAIYVIISIFLYVIIIDPTDLW